VKTEAEDIKSTQICRYWRRGRFWNLLLLLSNEW